MKIKTEEPHLPIRRLKRPLKRQNDEPDKPEDLLFGDKQGEELARVARRLYEGKIKKQI